MELLLPFIIVFIIWVIWFLNRPAKRAIITPIKEGGAISQQSFLTEKTVWDVIWGSDAVNLVRLLLDGFRAVMLLGWLWG